VNGICGQNDGAGHHWTGERAASGLVKASNVDEPGAPQFSLLIEGGIEVLQFPILFALLRLVATQFAVLGVAFTSSGTSQELHSRCALFTGCISVRRGASGYTQANIEGNRLHLLARGPLNNYTVDVQFSPAAFASAEKPQAIQRRILKAADCVFLRWDHPQELHRRCAIFTGCICVRREASGYTQVNIEGTRLQLLALGPPPIITQSMCNFP